MSNALPRVWMPINGIKYLKNVAIKICLDKIVAVKKGFTPADGLTAFVNVLG